MISKNQIKYIRSLEHKKYRDKYGVFVAEGRKLIDDLRTHFDLADLYEGDDACRASFQETPQGMLAIFRQADDNAPEPFPETELCLALDDIQNPGNMGTILRTCDWMGVSQVLCSRQTADCFAPKVVQATMGALAHLTVTYTDLPETLCQLRSEQGYAVLGTTLEGHDIYQSAALADAEKVVLVMGNEGNGLTPAVRQCLDEQLLLPAYGACHVESLNVAVATAWVLAEYRRIHSSAITL